MRISASLDTYGGEEVSITKPEPGKILIRIFSAEGSGFIALSEKRAKQLMLALAASIGYGANREPRNEVHFIFDTE